MTVTDKVIVAGVGMTAFTTPSRTQPYTELVHDAVRQALIDAGVEYEAIERAYAGYVYGDSTSGQRALYSLGMTGIPIFNVNNNCASGSTALLLAREAIRSGAHECVLAVGFDQMPSGAIQERFPNQPSPLEPFLEVLPTAQDDENVPLALRLFGGAARDYMRQYDLAKEDFASISVKSRRHALHNTKAVFRDPVTIEAVLASPLVFDPLTRLQCCPPTCGAAAAVLTSEAYARRHGIKRDVAIIAQAMTTDTRDSLTGDMISAVGANMTRRAAQRAFEDAGVGPVDMQVIELHDCFTSNEVLSYEALGLTQTGGAAKLIRDRDNTYGGRYVVNPSGGLLSKGHPLGATGLAQCYELTNQLRDRCGPRQVPGARLGMQHNIGLGGACVVGIYAKV